MARYQILKHRISNETGTFPAPSLFMRLWPIDNDHDINDASALIICESTDICDTCFFTRSLRVMMAFLICADSTGSKTRRRPISV